MSKVNITKKTVKNIVAVLLAGLLAFGAILGLTKIFGDDSQSMKKISSSVFHVGGLNTKGEYMETDDTIYSDLIECRGLTIEQKFESLSKYQVYFYNEDKAFISRSEEFKNYNYTIDDNVDIAKFCRIVINPMQQSDDSETFKIRFYEVLGYANDFTIKVYATQNYVSPDLLRTATVYDKAEHGDNQKNAIGSASSMLFTSCSCNDSVSFTASSDTNVLAINVSNIGSLKIDDSKSSIGSVLFLKSDKSKQSKPSITLGSVNIVEVPTDATYCLITYSINKSVGVKKYSLR